MTRPARRETLTSILLCHVSAQALDYGLEMGLFSRPVPETEPPLAALGLLARMRVWLRLIFGGVFKSDVTVQAECRLDDAPLNRRCARRRRKWSDPNAYDHLGYMILRQQGLTRWQQWLYNCTLIGRVRWCFPKSLRRNMSVRRFCKGFDTAIKLISCNAPLRPD